VRKQYSFLFIIFVLFTSCDENSTDVGDSTVDQYDIFSNNPVGKDGYLYSFIYKKYLYDFSAYNNYSKHDWYFYDNSGNPATPLDIIINGTSSNQHKSNDLPYDGSPYSYDIVGNLTTVPTFSITNNGVGFGDIITPLPDSITISKSNGFTLTYTAFPNATNMVVRIRSAQQLSRLLLDSTISVNEAYEEYHTASKNGVFTITPAMLNSIPNNRYFFVELFGYNQIDTTISNKNYLYTYGASLQLTYKVQ
jgi:hypothetical protein